jgi:hypothetical protein
LEVVRVNLENDFFEMPTRAEYKAAKRHQYIDPESLDGREMWILRNFSKGDFEWD